MTIVSIIYAKLNNTPQLSFHVGDADMDIPVIRIRQVKALGRKDMLEVTLVSGEILEGSSTSSIEGEWELGAYSLELSKAKSIVFEHSKIPDWKQPVGFVAQVNGTTLYGLEYQFAYSGCSTWWIPCKPYTAHAPYLWLPVVIKGPELYFIPFSKIKQASPNEVVLTDGSTVKARLYLGKDDALFDGGTDRKIKGQTASGTIELPIEKVKSITFLHDKDLKIPLRENYPNEFSRKNFESDSRLKGTIVVSGGVPIDVDPLDFIWSGCEGPGWAKGQELEVYIGEVGEALSKIELAKLTAIREFRIKRHQDGGIEDLRAKIIAKSGNQMSVRVKDPGVCFGGKLDLGYVKVRAADVEAVEFK